MSIQQRLILLLTFVLLVACSGSGSNSPADKRISLGLNVQPDTYELSDSSLRLSVHSSEGVIVNDHIDDEISDPEVILGQPPKYHQGEFFLSTDGGFEYDYHYSDSNITSDKFTYFLKSGELSSDPVTVTINFPENFSPSVQIGCKIFDQENIDNNHGTITGELKSLVRDVDSPTLMFAAVSNPLKGTLDIDANQGTFTYTPLANIKSQGYKDTFRFQVSDLEGGITEAGFDIIYGAARIMPLGDSITYGNSTVSRDYDIRPLPERSIAYRKKLYELLTDAKYTFDFVGSQSTGAMAGLPDTNHQGMGGWTSSHLAYGRIDKLEEGNISTWLEKTPADIILLHIGTNDHNSYVMNIHTILTKAKNWAKNENIDIKFLVAKIIDHRPDSPYTNNIGDFNNNLENMLETNWPDAHVVDMYSVVDNDLDMTPINQDFTGLHPTSSGYEKMGAAWFESLNASGFLHHCKE